MNMQNSKVFGFDKTGYLSDLEIEALYQKKSELVADKTVQDKLFRASFYDPRKLDVFFDSVESANKGKGIADKLHRMTAEEFLSSDYAYRWFDGLSGASLFKIVNKNVLKQSEGGDNTSMIKKFFQFIRINYIWVLAASIVILLFYWLQLRPSLIRKSCHNWIIDQPGEINVIYKSDRKEYDALYEYCLHGKGLK